MKYSIIMPYYERIDQLWNTLVSFKHHYAGRDDFETIVTVDAKNQDDVFQAMRAFTGHLSVRFNYPIDSRVSNPAPHFNLGVKTSVGEYIILTSPECLHESDILSGLDQHFAVDPGGYVVCACRSMRNCSSRIEQLDDFRGEFHMWYQHSVHRNERYHFCTALSRQRYDEVGGFDEAFAYGIGYDDNDFRDRVEAAGILFIVDDSLVVNHQEHSKQCKELDRGHYNKLLNRNRKLYESKCQAVG